MIRSFKSDDIEHVFSIWLNGNIQAHNFIPVGYWKANAPMVREQLLSAEIYVYETDENILGFVGIQGDYLAGIFVKESSRSMGVGRQLLNYVKKIHPALSLNVYQKNSRAVEFYKREGFSVVSEGIDEGTGEADYTMTYTADVLENFPGNFTAY